MSAFQVPKSHILYLVAAATSPTIVRPWHQVSWSDPSGARHMIGGGDATEAARIANVLAAENARSVDHRYPNGSNGPAGRDVFEPRDMCRVMACDAAQVIRACDCYNYQACETDDYDATEAAAFIRAVRESAVNRLVESDAERRGVKLAWTIDAVPFRPEPRDDARAPVLARSTT